MTTTLVATGDEQVLSELYEAFKPVVGDLMTLKLHLTGEDGDLDTAAAVKHLRDRMAYDDTYALSWLANMALCYYDVGLTTPREAYMGAARFIRQTFGVDVTRLPVWSRLESRWGLPSTVK